MGGAGIQNEDKMSLGKKELSFPEKESHQKKKKRTEKDREISELERDQWL